MENKKVIFRGYSTSTLLGIAFIVLKLCGIIDWAWIWVLAPFWVPFALVTGILMIIIIIQVIIGLVAVLRDR